MRTQALVIFSALCVASAACSDTVPAGTDGGFTQGDANVTLDGDGDGGTVDSQADATPEATGDGEVSGPDIAAETTVDGSSDGAGAEVVVDAGLDADPDVTTDAVVDGMADQGDVVADTNDEVADTAIDATLDQGDAMVDTAVDVVPTDTTSDVPPPDNGCPTYHKFCDGQCVNVAVSATHCGDCDVACEAPQACSAGACSDSCLPGQEACAGVCVNTDVSADHCGNCGETCPQGQGCVGGNCQPSLPLGPAPAECTGFESPIVLGEGDQATCLGEQAQVEFTWAICSCDYISINNKVMTDAYDSTAGPYAPGQIGGGIGSNGGLVMSNATVIGGSLFTASPEGVVTGNTYDVLGELHSGGPLTVGNVTNIGYDAYIAGNSTGTINIGGTLFTPSTSNVGAQVTAAAVVNQPVTVAPPCRCDEKIPVTDIVANYATSNDNAKIGLAADALINPSGKLHVALPCGVYYLDGIQTNQELTIVATGRVALMIGGDLTSGSKLHILPAPSGELDVFVGGTMNVNNEVVMGSPNYPALMRVYVGSSAPLNFNNSVDIGGFFYAAHSPVNIGNKFEMFGGLITGSLDANNEVKVHYDRGVLKAGVDCPAPPTSGECTTCADCGNQACVDGQCGACETSADCCSPLICAGGQCISLSVTPD